MTGKSWLTAVRRNKPSAPLKFLLKHGLIKGRILDYGCGRGDDCKHLYTTHDYVVGYDPYFQPI
ncbi:MAG: methyltransferase domain-containing protein, partial [Candidatus Thorarchaeota archaeon]